MVPLAKGFGINGAKLGMVAAPAFCHVVVEAGNKQGFQFRQPVDQTGGQGVFGSGLGAVEPHHITDHPHGVGVYRIDMEKVVLHLPDDLAELRQVAAQHVVLLHGRQSLVQGMGRA